MTDTILTDATRKLLAAGWAAIPDEGFVGLVGPFFQRDGLDGPSFCFPVDDRHRNLRGVAQGGALMTFSDRVMGMAARQMSGSKLTTTVQFNFQFVESVQIGDVVETAPTVIRSTKHLIFLHANLLVKDRTVGVAGGVWKRLIG